ncbi:unnamed protein product, partial [Tilletia caries]
PSVLPAVNAHRAGLAARVAACLFWRDGEHELSEDFTRPLRALDGPAAQWTFSFAHVDAFCAPLGVPWSDEKEQGFGFEVTYYGCVFDLPARTIALPERKRAKMRADIQAWLGESSRTHTLASAEALLGLLQFGTHVVPNGRPYLSGLVQFLGMHAAAAARRRAGGQRAAFVPVVSRSFANDLDLLDPGLYTDASGSGAGVVIGDRVAADAFDPA